MKWISALRRPVAMTFYGALALAFVLWFEGPLLAFDGHAPLASEASRWVLIALVFAVWGLYWGGRWLRTRLASSNFVRSLVANAAAGSREPDEGQKAAEGDLAILRTRFEEALKTLRRAGAVKDPARDGKMDFRSRWLDFGRQTIYDLPWYMFVGAPGAGKTTALVHSGLNFPLADRLGAQAVGGVGGTRHCDWWFTDDAVLLDTAGRFTTQDSHRAADRSAWLAFLQMLRKYRRRRPLNGVMVVVSALDLLQLFRLSHLGGADLHHRFGGRVRLADLGDLARLVARDMHDRMHDQMNVEVLAPQLGGHRIDQKRHVVVHDLDDRVAGTPAMFILMRVEDADLRAARLALVGELPERERGAEQVFRRFLRDVGHRHIGVELPDEGLGLSLARAFDPSADEADDLVHQLLFQGFGFHDCPDLGILSRALHGSGSGRARRSLAQHP